MKFKERIIKTRIGEWRVSECRATASDDTTVIYVNSDPTKPALTPAQQLDVIIACAAEQLPAIDSNKLKYSKQYEGFILAKHVGARIWIEHPKFAPRTQLATRGAKAA